jgi:hypothetical protein
MLNGMAFLLIFRGTFCSSWCEDSKGCCGNAFIALLVPIFFLAKKLLAVSLSGDKYFLRLISWKSKMVVSTPK